MKEIRETRSVTRSQALARAIVVPIILLAAVAVQGQTTALGQDLVSGGSSLARMKTLCFEVETDWIDPLPASAPKSHGGDRWRLNENRPPSGAKVAIRNDIYQLDNRGCVTFAVPGLSFPVTIWSEGTVNGIDIVSYTDWGPDGPDDGSEPDLTGIFRNASQTWTVGSRALKETLVLPASDLENSIAWHSYVLVAFALAISDYNLGDYGNDSNCLGRNVPCCNHSPWPGIPEKTIYTHTMRPGYGYGSTWPANDWVDNQGVLRVSGHGNLFNTSDSVPSLGSGKLDRWQMAHELGHIIVMLRMGGRTQTDYSAPLNYCMGTYWAGDFGEPSDDGHPDSKAPLSREYSAGAAREGWGHFFAAQLYNSTREDDCWYDSEHFMDFDLDGDIDNDYPGNTYKDGVFTCEGAGVEPLLGEPIPSDPLASWFDDRNWLEDVWWNPSFCGDMSGQLNNRGKSSQYDWMRYYWDMATDEQVPVEKLVDVYVDMCPTDWTTSISTTFGDDLPESRLRRSNIFHGLGAEHRRQKDNGVGLN